MICANCQRENDASANFCTNCGAGLQRSCPNCGTPAGPTANFCSNCGHELKRPVPATGAVPQPRSEQETAKPSSYVPAHLARKILRDRSAISGERRTVTVLFVDAVGSTAVGEGLDPEELYNLTQAATRRMMDAVHLYEGTVTQFLGDGILALFGAPIAHEDAARRAVAAALEMQRSLGEYALDIQSRLGVDLRYRVGINTGRVVVGHIDDDLDIEFTALGDTVNLASRLETIAEPGAVYVSEATFQAARDYIDFEPVGPLELKGKSDPIRAYRAVGERALRTRIEAATERGLTPYVGRLHERDLLQRRLRQATRGRGQVVLITGDAGIGKSRLLLEFRRSVQREVSWWEGQCISYGKNIPYRPIIDLVRTAFQVQEADSEARIIQRLEEGAAGWEATARATLPYLRTLLSVDPGDPAVPEMEPRERRAGIYDGLRALLLQESRHRPLVLVVEDLHWIDEQSQNALRVVVDAVAAAPVLLLLTARSGYAHALGERSYLDRLALAELPQEQSTALAKGVLAQSALPGEILSLIVGKGEGNPFYIEEVARSLVESGALNKHNGNYTLARPVEGIRVPDTIQEIILSRIDHLHGDAKAALQLASVIGREFTARLLERISDLEAELDAVLGELKALELIYQEAYFPELSYMFKHALTQDVAYRTLLRERRKSLHRLIGKAIEELYADRLPEQIEMLAHHYYEGEAWEKALEYLVKAGEKAAAAYANQDALSYYSRALEVSEQTARPDLRLAAEVARKQGLLYLTIGNLESSIAGFSQMRNLAQRQADGRLEGLAMALRGGSELMAHNPVAAEKSLSEALAIAGDEYEDVRFFASAILAQTFKNFGRHGEAVSYYEQAKRLAAAVDDPFMISWWRAAGSMWPHWEGRFDDALEVHRRYRGGDDLLSMWDLDKVWMQALSLGGAGRYQNSLDLLVRVLAVCERVGDKLIRTRVLNTIGWVYGELQDHRRAMDWNTRGLKATQAAGFINPEVESNARLNLGDNLMALGQLDEAEEHFQHVERIARDPRPEDLFALWRYSQRLFHSYGELWLARGDLDRAFAYAHECIALAEETNSRKNIVKGRRLHAQVLLARGQLDEAEGELRIALDIAQQVGNPTQLWRTQAAYGDLKAAQEQPDQAQESYRRALQIIRRVAAGLADQKLRDTLLAAGAVQLIRKKSRLGS